MIVVVTKVKMSPIGTLFPNLSKVPTVKWKLIVKKLKIGNLKEVVRNYILMKFWATPNIAPV